MMTALAVTTWAATYTGTLTVDGTVSSTSATASISGTTVTLNNVPDYGTVTLTGAVTTDVTATVTNDISVLTGSGTVDGKPATLVAAYKAETIGKYSTQAMYASVVVDGGKNIQFTATPVGYHVMNGDFEEWTKDEPRYWHSFQSAYGGYASWAGTHLVKNTTVSRPGHGNSACIYATKVLSSIANGTVTTGIVKAGAVSATDYNNHAEMQIAANSDYSSNGLDKYNDPFYMPMAGKPDRFQAWVKLVQSSTNSSYPYAKVKAVITDGEYYQEPSGTTYKNVLCSAENAQITKSSSWGLVDVAFNYASFTSNNAQGKTIFIVASTNAEPGKGAAKDSLYLDDIDVVYQGALSDVKVKGVTVPGWNAATATYTINADDYTYTLTAGDLSFTKSEGAYAYVVKDVVKTDAGYTATVSVASNDLASSVHTYTIYVNVPAQPASATLYVHDAEGAPAVNGTTLSDTETGQYVEWYKTTLGATVNDFPMTVTLTASNGDEATVTLDADDVKYYSFTAGSEVQADYNPYADKQITIYVRNMDNDQMAPTLYAWNDRGELNGAWAGTVMTESEVLNDRYTWYKHTFTGIPSANVIFSLGSSSTQTADINGVEAEVNYFKYYPYGDWERYEAVSEPEKTTVTLADYIAANGLIEDAHRKFLADELFVAATASDGISASDGNGNWVLLAATEAGQDLLLEPGQSYGPCAFLVSDLIYSNTVHDLKSVVLNLDEVDAELVQAAGTGEFTPDVKEYRLYDLNVDNLPVVNEAAIIIGYYKANDRGGTLRAYSPKDGQHQGMSIDLLDNGGYKDQMADGHIYSVPGVILLRSDLNFPPADGIRLMDVENPSDEMYDGVLRMMLFQLDINGEPVDNTATGINDVNAAGIKEVKEIYNAAGQRVNTLDSHGIYILRLSDGSSVKIAR